MAATASITCASTLETSLAEVRFHQERFLRRTQQGPIRLELRLYLSKVDARLADVRKLAEYHDPDDYAAGQRLGRQLHRAGGDGVLYRSVRHRGGLCAAVFRPKVLGPCQQSTHFAFHYNGESIVAIDALSSVWMAGT